MSRKSHKVKPDFHSSNVIKGGEVPEVAEETSKNVKEAPVVEEDDSDDVIFSVSVTVEDDDNLAEMSDRISALSEQIERLRDVTEDLLATNGTTRPENFGAIADGVFDCSDAIEAAANSSEEITLSAGVYRVTRSIMILSDVIIRRGAKLLVADGASVKIFGRITAGRYQIFAGWIPDQSTPHEATDHDKNRFEIITPQPLNPEWWGAVSKSTVNSRPAFQRAILAASTRCSLNLVHDQIYYFGNGGLYLDQPGDLVFPESTRIVYIKGHNSRISQWKTAKIVFNGNHGIFIHDLGIDNTHIEAYNFDHILLSRVETDTSSLIKARNGRVISAHSCGLSSHFAFDTDNIQLDIK